MSRRRSPAADTTSAAGPALSVQLFQPSLPASACRTTSCNCWHTSLPSLPLLLHNVLLPRCLPHRQGVKPVCSPIARLGCRRRESGKGCQRQGQSMVQTQQARPLTTERSRVQQASITQQAQQA